MFKIKVVNEKKPADPKKFQYMFIPKDKEGHKSRRSLRWLPIANDPARIFVERLKNYKVYIISVGTNPGAVEVRHVATDLASALTLAKNLQAEIEENARKANEGR